MYTKIQLVFDAAEPEKLAEFWGLALGYVVEPPPEGFESWADFARSAGIPEDEWGEVSSRVDPAWAGPGRGGPRKAAVSPQIDRMGSE